MQLTKPFCISARLLPAVKIGDAFISITFDGESNGRTRYRYYIDAPGLEHSSNDLKSGVGGGSLEQGMGNLLCFLSAAAESYRYQGNKCTGDPDDNSSLFPPEVVEWAYQNDDEITMTQMEIEESQTDLITD